MCVSGHTRVDCSSVAVHDMNCWAVDGSGSVERDLKTLSISCASKALWVTTGWLMLGCV